MSALPPETSTPPFALPSRLQALWFWTRIRLLTLQRIAQDARAPHIRRWPAVNAAHSALSQAPVLAEVRSPLWSDGRSDEFALAAGKVHNLRLALKAFDGVELPAGAVLSFWQQLGRITRSKGFVLGREIREGCVVPTVGGGICQLSNALATAASRAGFTLLERHGHTALIEAASRPHGAPATVDATVLWKHIDLRIVTDRPLRLELVMDASQLILRLRAKPSAQPMAETHFPVHLVKRPRPSAELPVVRSCVTCNETSCFRHQPDFSNLAGQQGQSLALLEGLTPELAAWLEQTPSLRGTLQLPHALTTGQRQQVAHELLGVDWPTKRYALWNRASAMVLAFRRALWLRWNAHSQGQRQASILDGQRWQCAHALRQIHPTDTQLLLDQAYLPALQQSGQLPGRQLTVWMPALPMQAIIEQLDHAAQCWPDEPSLRDFRPAPALVAAELQALQSAQHIITAHHGVARWVQQHLKAQLTLLPWCDVDAPNHPTPCADIARGAIQTIVFPSSTLARKGWCELCHALAQMPAQPMQLIVLGSSFNTEKLPPHVKLQRMRHDQDWTAQASVVVLPAHVEHNPRTLLRALAEGLPVIATPACGLPEQKGLTLVPAGDAAALAQSLLALQTQAPAKSGYPPLKPRVCI